VSPSLFREGAEHDSDFLATLSQFPVGCKNVFRRDALSAMRSSEIWGPDALNHAGPGR